MEPTVSILKSEIKIRRIDKMEPKFYNPFG